MELSGDDNDLTLASMASSDNVTTRTRAQQDQQQQQQTWDSERQQLLAQIKDLSNRVASMEESRTGTTTQTSDLQGSQTAYRPNKDVKALIKSLKVFKGVTGVKQHVCQSMDVHGKGYVTRLQ